jgi:hypothetical protein
MAVRIAARVQRRRRTTLCQLPRCNVPRSGRCRALFGALSFKSTLESTGLRTQLPPAAPGAGSLVAIPQWIFALVCDPGHTTRRPPIVCVMQRAVAGSLRLGVVLRLFREPDDSVAVRLPASAQRRQPIRLRLGQPEQRFAAAIAFWGIDDAASRQGGLDGTVGGGHGRPSREALIRCYAPGVETARQVEAERATVSCAGRAGA